MIFTFTYYVTVLTAIIGGSAQFYTYDVINPAQVTLIKWLNQTYISRNELKTEAELNMIWSMTVSCIAVGAIFGALSTKLGRRNGLIFNGIFNVIGALMVYNAKLLSSPEILVIGRVILGVNMGVTSGLVPMYLMEITPTKYRGSAGTCHMVAVAFSDWFSMLMALPEIFGGENTWPIAFGFPGITALLLCCILPFCPESPKFSLLIKQDRVTTLNDIGKLVDIHEGQKMYEELIKERGNNLDNNGKMSLSYLFKSKELRMPLIICVWVMVAQQFTGAAAIFAYSTNMFLNAGLEPKSARFSTLGIGIMYFLFACSSVHLIELKGRRALSFFQLSTVTVSLIAMSIFTWAQEYTKLASYGAIISLLAYMCGYGIGSPIPWMISSEIFPTRYRSSAVTVSITVSWSLVFIISLLYLPFKEWVGISASYLPFIIVSAISTCFRQRNRHTNEIAQDIQFRSDTIRRYSLNILPSIGSSMGISPSNDASEDIRLNENLIPRTKSFNSPSTPTYKYSSFSFTPPGENDENFLSKFWGRKR
ncbi:MFS domain-containing protein [Meloidogyne graminicola]|uniref:MFS domain-containing protein n=1 Tax=Meloidogyne graminicola TaxID=189291 RepID=A0A8S9ZFN2_9BILA|nr:MFS domain-containing protein [Meloidogyne graminicola]